MTFGKQRGAGIRHRVLAWFPEREIFLRSGGTVRFVRISPRLQIGVAAAIGLLLTTWAAATLVMAFGRADLSLERALLARQRADVVSSSAAVSAYRKSTGGIATELEARQDLIEKLVKSHLGDTPATPSTPATVASASPAPAARKTSALTPGDSPPDATLPDAGRLQALARRQTAFARDVARAADARTRRAETALRSLGLNPRTMLANAQAHAQGGPFIPWRGPKGGSGDMLTPELKTLADSLQRMDAVEATLLTVPSSRPTDAPMVTSSYGYRRDPFNGQPAFHAGLDFVGRYGQPILAAAGGRVSFVGQKSGYGNCLEVDHGHGIVTRYAHLSGFTARIGQQVARGQQIARMGSTGRSTGTHLHFEVRVNDQPLNPRRFLEARQDVLQVQQIALARDGRAAQNSNDHGRDRG